MRILIAALSIAALAAPAVVAAQPAEATAAPVTGPYTVEQTQIGTLLDDPAAKVVLDQHLPGFSKQPQIDMARPMTLKAVQQFAPDQITDAALAAIQADLSKLPTKK